MKNLNNASSNSNAKKDPVIGDAPNTGKGKIDVDAMIKQAIDAHEKAKQEAKDKEAADKKAARQEALAKRVTAAQEAGIADRLTVRDRAIEYTESAAKLAFELASADLVGLTGEVFKAAANAHAQAGRMIKAAGHVAGSEKADLGKALAGSDTHAALVMTMIKAPADADKGDAGKGDADKGE